MALKFNRDYLINVDTINANTFGPTLQNASTRSVEIKPPFTIEFDLDQNTNPGHRTLDLTIYNLGLATRTLLRKDYVEIDKPAGTLDERQIEFWAGYAGSVPTRTLKNFHSTAQATIAQKQSQHFPTVFRGIVANAYSVREGSNFITKLECKDQGYIRIAPSSKRSFTAGTPYRKMIIDLISDIPGITVGAIGDFPKVIKKGQSFGSDPVAAILALTAGRFFIFNQKAYCLNDNEYLPGPTPLISEASGLIGTPKINATLITVRMVFEPSLVLGQGVELKSKTAPTFNGFYKITAIHHQGIISPTTCGTAITTVEMTNYASLVNSLFTLVSP